MISKFRAWNEELKLMLDVPLIDFKKRGIVGEHWGFGETNFISFDDIELMQSTGLKDKNGREVFIGDIIKCTRGCLHEVYIEKEYGGTYIGGMPAIYLKGLLEGYAWTGDEEILGNIWEDGELLDSENTEEN